MNFYHARIGGRLPATFHRTDIRFFAPMLSQMRRQRTAVAETFLASLNGTDIKLWPPMNPHMYALIAFCPGPLATTFNRAEIEFVTRVMAQNVDISFSLCRERLSTVSNQAEERLFSPVSTKMAVQGGPLPKHFSALLKRADIGLLSCMRPQVICQHIPVAKTCPASLKRADIGLLSRMPSLVIPAQALAAKSCPASLKRAEERLFSHMSSNVIAQRAQLSENFSALLKRAQIRLFARVHAQVIFQHSPIGKTCPTSLKRAEIRFGLRRDAHLAFSIFCWRILLCLPRRRAGRRLLPRIVLYRLQPLLSWCPGQLARLTKGAGTSPFFLMAATVKSQCALLANALPARLLKPGTRPVLSTRSKMCFQHLAVSEPFSATFKRTQTRLFSRTPWPVNLLFFSWRGLLSTPCNKVGMRLCSPMPAWRNLGRRVASPAPFAAGNRAKPGLFFREASKGSTRAESSSLTCPAVGCRLDQDRLLKLNNDTPGLGPSLRFFLPCELTPRLRTPCPGTPEHVYNGVIAQLSCHCLQC